MKTSEKYMTVAAELLKIQSSLSVDMDGENKHLGNKYATLDNILKTVKPKFNEVGLLILQCADINAEGKQLVCTTRIVHPESGEWIESTSTLPIEKSSAQGIGSATTYGRRYGLCTLVGIAEGTDDDATTAEFAMVEGRQRKAKDKVLEDRKSQAVAEFMGFDVDPMSVAFEELGYVSAAEDKAEMVKDLVGQIDSAAKLTNLFRRTRALQEQVNDTPEKTENQLL